MIDNLQKSVLVSLLAVLVPASASAAEQTYKFDFGTEKSPVFAGFIQVDKKTLYSKQRGFGWQYGVTGEAREHFDRENYDDLCCDFVLTRASTFNVDMPSGRYLVNIWIGDLHDLYDYLRFGIKAEERVFVKAHDVDFKTYSDFYFKNNGLDYRKGDNPWDKYINTRFILKTFLVEVLDEQMNIEFRNCRVNAMVVYPAELKEQGQQEVLSINSKRRKQFEGNWTEIKHTEVSSELKVSPEDMQRGYVLFSRHWMEKIYPETVPDEDEVCTGINISCARGEYEPITFGVYPLRDLKNVRIMVEHLFDSSGTKFDTRNIEVRMDGYRIARSRDSMTYSIQPAQITEFREIDIERGVARKFWLDFYVPVETKPGIYEGTVWIKPVNKPASKLMLKLKVLSFELFWDKQRHNYALQYPTPGHYRPFRNVTNYWKCLERDYQFMKKFGITMPTLGYDNNTWPIIRWNSKTKRLEDINLSRIEKGMEVYNKVGGFRSSYVIYCMYRMTSWGYHSVPQKRNASGNATSEQEPEFWRAYQEIVRAIKKRQVEKGWPEFIFLPTAEMSNSYLDYIRYGKKIHETLQEVPGIKVAGMPNSWKELQMLAPRSNIVGMQITLCTDKAVGYGKEKSLDHSFWVYQSNNRFTYGFYHHKIEAKGSFKEVFQTVSGDPYNSFDGRWDEVLASTAYSLPSADGPVPMLQCYEYREGIDDARYLHTLEQHIEKAKVSMNPRVREAAKDSEEVLKQVLTWINTDLTYYRNEVGFWDNLAYDKLRQQIVGEIVKLNSLD